MGSKAFTDPDRFIAHRRLDAGRAGASRHSISVRQTTCTFAKRAGWIVTAVYVAHPTRCIRLLRSGDDVAPRREGDPEPPVGGGGEACGRGISRCRTHERTQQFGRRAGEQILAGRRRLATARQAQSDCDGHATTVPSTPESGVAIERCRFDRCPAARASNCAISRLVRTACSAWCGSSGRCSTGDATRPRRWRTPTSSNCRRRTASRASGPAPDELDRALARALGTEGPVLIDIRQSPVENTLPFVPSGRTLEEMILRAE